jgi:ketosteroid isomerase-like protein
MRYAPPRRYGATIAFLLWLPACAPGPQHSEADVTSVLESFYGAMKTGDKAAAMRVIAPDAVFLEAGGLETRAEYEANHLPADIAFEREVTGRRGDWSIRFEGNTAWGIATTEYEGTFEGKRVNFVGAQLAVLTRESGDWQIRTIRWSSRRR